MKNIVIIFLAFVISFTLIYPMSAQQPAINHNQNYTAILTYGQTPYQIGFLSKDNITGWTWWDSNDSIQDRKQQNVIFVNILGNGTPAPVTGLSPPSFNRTAEKSNTDTYSYKADNDGQGHYSNNLDIWHFLDDHSTYAPPWEDTDLLNSTAAALSFSTYYEIEDNRDFGYVKISTDRGKTWTQLAEYTGDSGGWVQKTIDLDPYAGEEAIIAFNFRSDNKNVEQGWYIDDISVSTTGTGTGSTSLLSSIWNWITSLVGILSVEILSDGAENSVPNLSVTVIYPTYNHNTSNFSTRQRIVDLVENYQSQGLYYGTFLFENENDVYTGEYTVNFNQVMPDLSPISVSTSFNTTLWGCQARGCHDTVSFINNPSGETPNASIHPNELISPGVPGDCQSLCHGPYSSQFLTATPSHLHEIKYGHEGGFIIGEKGNITIFNVSSPSSIVVTMYSESNMTRPRSQTAFNVESHTEIVDCKECHTTFVHAKTGGDVHPIAQPDTLTGTNISSTGVHAVNVTCQQCHGTLSYPTIPDQYSLNGTIGDYDPVFTSYLTNTKTYFINVSNDINLTVDIENTTYGITLTLIGPMDNPSGLLDLNTGDSWEGTYFVPSIDGQIIFKTGSDVLFPLGGLKVSTFTSAPSQGIWIARLFSWSTGSTNYTITSDNPIVEKPIIHIPWNCSECHNPSGIGNASANRPIPLWDNNGLSFAHTDFDNDSKGDVPCRSCHNSFHEISILNCQECHNSPPSGHTNIVEGYDYPDAPYPNCISCHGDPHDIGPGGGANCTDCHLEGGSYTDWNGPILNRTGFFNSVHHNITGDFDANNYSQISKVCWGCHNDYGQQLVDPKHYKIRPDCTDCHADPNSWNSAYLTPPQAVEHQPNGTAITTPNANCTLCHNMSLVNGMPPAVKVKNPTPRNFISHYGRQRTDIIIDDGAASNCSYCHLDDGHEFGPVFADRDKASILHGEDCAACHGYGRIHDDVFVSADGDAIDRETYPFNLSTGDITGVVSHSPPYAISGTFNLTWDGSSLELVVVPPSALTSSGMNISEYAGTYYNSSIAWNVSGTGTDILFNENIVLTDTVNTTYKFISVDYPEEGEWHCYVVALDADHTNATLEIEWVYNLFANCTHCHLEGGGNSNWNGPILNQTGFFNSSHYNITGDFNNSKYSQISKVCWGCHVDFAQQLVDPGHTKPASELPECEDCHFNDTPLNGDYLRKKPPLQIPEHQPLGEDVQTNISTNCTFCHNNSLSIPIPTTKVKYHEAKNYVSHYVSTTYLMTPTNNTTDCIWCHVYHSDNISWGYPPDPMTSTKLDHTDLNITNNSGCYPCHVSYKALNGSVLLPGFTFHNISMASGAGNDCVYCHDIGGIVREEFQIDVQGMNQSGAIHYDLNGGAADTLDANNERCWACHGDGDGSEADQPQGHPVNFRNPRNCSEKDCHNVNQSILNEPMVYEHFKYVDEIDENLTTAVNCPACHLNSIVNHQDSLIPSDTSLVSHYGSTHDLINTSSCIYCHLDEDNAEEWGNAPDPTSNISRPSDKEWESTLFIGDKWHLGNRYFLIFEDIAVDGDSAYLRLYLGDTLLEELVVDERQDYTYEGDFIDPDGKDVKAIVLEIDFTTIFRGNMETGLVKAKASPWKRIHPEIRTLHAGPVIWITM